MFTRVLVLCISAAVLAAPALAQDAAPPQTPTIPEVSGITVTPKARKLDPKMQCPDDACIKAVVQELRTRFPKQYESLMQWCMSKETERMALQSSDWNGLLGGNETLQVNPAHGEAVVCADRFSKK